MRTLCTIRFDSIFNSLSQRWKILRFVSFVFIPAFGRETICFGSSTWKDNIIIIRRTVLCHSHLYSSEYFAYKNSFDSKIDERIEWKSAQLQLFTLEFKRIGVMVTWTMWFRFIKNSRRIHFPWLFNRIYYCPFKNNRITWAYMRDLAFSFWSRKKLKWKIKYSVLLVYENAWVSICKFHLKEI